MKTFLRVPLVLKSDAEMVKTNSIAGMVKK